MKKTLAALAAFCLVASAHASRSFSATNLPIRVKFTATRIGIVKDNGTDYVKGRISADVRSSQDFFTKPLLRVVLLTEENGSCVIRDTIMNEPNLKVEGEYDTYYWWNTYGTQKTTTRSTANNEPYYHHHYYTSDYRKTIEEISRLQSEVSKAQYAKSNYEGLPLGSVWRKGIKGSRRVPVFGYCRFNQNEKAKVLGYRIEMWYAGECAAWWESFSAADVKKYQLPDDWHVTLKSGESVFANPKRFKYRSPWEMKDVSTR